MPINRREFVKLFGITASAVAGGAAGKRRAAAAPGDQPAPAGIPAADLYRQFTSPPPESRCWVYWFWLDGNITRDGITADLEAMHAAGIGGVLIMEVAQGTPPGPVRFGTAEWRDMFAFMCTEAKRLGIKVNMNNDAGWCGSGGPWVTAEMSMQVLVHTTTRLHGGSVDVLLPQPPAKLGFYRDVAVLAFPTPPAQQHGKPYAIGRLSAVNEATAQDKLPGPAAWPAAPAGQSVPASRVVDISRHMNPYGQLVWKAPPGDWTVMRFGHTSTGVANHPAPIGGLGLETDKLSRRATEVQFHGLMDRLIQRVGPLAGSTLVSTHIDSWEIGSQNWSRNFRADFKRLRGYDLLKFLPAMAGQVVGTLGMSERFLWDVRATISDLLVENYSLAMRKLAAKRRLRLSIEGYSGVPVDEMRYGGSAVEPMSELWSWGRYWAAQSVTNMTSAGHVYGAPIIGQETFTAGSDEKWQGHPAVVKDIGDWAFSQGVNRFVVHRYALQPFNNIAPGVSMGPWGLHYERTQTWWQHVRPWHEYVARCQHLLRQGNFVADLLYLQPQQHPTGCPALPGAGNPNAHPRYKGSGCPADVVLHRLRVKDKMLVLPDGMRYRALVLPAVETMTPDLLRKLVALARAGAVIIATGQPPTAAPGLTNFPQCDAHVQQLAKQLWASGKLIVGKTPEQALAGLGIPPDFQSDVSLDYAHRHTADADIYFIANRREEAVEATCTFRVTGRTPEIWDPETGTRSPAILGRPTRDGTRIRLRLDWKQAVFVVFGKGKPAVQPVVLASRNGKAIFHPRQPLKVRIVHASYGPPSDPARTRDVTAIVQGLVNKHIYSFPVVKIAAIGGDPAFRVVKTLHITYRAGRTQRTYTGEDGATAVLDRPPLPQTLLLEQSATCPAAIAFRTGRYVVKTRSRPAQRVSIASLPKPMPLDGPWSVEFPPGLGAPERISLDQLASLSEHAVAGVRYFSGTATYRHQFRLANEDFLKPGIRVFLHLGVVAVMADVVLNGKPMGTLWKPPFTCDISAALRPGNNVLSIAVSNLWVNRLIGDQQLPPDAQWAPDGHLLHWPDWVLEGKKSPTGRIAFTTWQLWHQNDPLVASGLIGPVRLVAGREVAL